MVSFCFDLQRRQWLLIGSFRPERTFLGKKTAIRSAWRRKSRKPIQKLPVWTTKCRLLRWACLKEDETLKLSRTKPFLGNKSLFACVFEQISRNTAAVKTSPCFQWICQPLTRNFAAKFSIKSAWSKLFTWFVWFFLTESRTGSIGQGEREPPVGPCRAAKRARPDSRRGNISRSRGQVDLRPFAEGIWWFRKVFSSLTYFFFHIGVSDYEVRDWNWPPAGKMVKKNAPPSNFSSPNYFDFRFQWILFDFWVVFECNQTQKRRFF